MSKYTNTHDLSAYNCASFFTGIGGIDKGFEDAGFRIVYANEFDPYSVKTYENNFNLKVDCRDIREVQASEIPEFQVMLAGFPCQAFSVAGYRQGFNDEKGRGTLFFELVRIFKEKKPEVIFLENVKNLVSHDNGNTFKVILQELQDAGYNVKFQVMNAMEYGNIPQNRERIYIVAFRNKEWYKNFNFPAPVKLETKLTQVINFLDKVDDLYYYTKGKYKGDIYEKLEEAMKNDNYSVYQWRRKYVRKNKKGVVPTLTANQGEGGHNVCLIKTRFGIRKMTPRECFSVQGFSEDFVLPKDVSDTRLYKQAGNSVCVSVIQRIAEKIKEVIEHTT